LRKRIKSGIELKRRNPKDMGSKYQLSKSDSEKLKKQEKNSSEETKIFFTKSKKLKPTVSRKMLA
jgi:hypothetical protein